MINKYEIKRNMRNIINTTECERRGEIDSALSVILLKLPSAKTTEGAEDDVCKMEKTVDLAIVWVNTPKSIIQEGSELAKQEILGYAKIAMSEVDTECIFSIKNHTRI